MNEHQEVALRILEAIMKGTMADEHFASDIEDMVDYAFRMADRILSKTGKPKKQENEGSGE